MCDRVVTVAPSYAEEIMTTEGAWGMEEITKRRFEHTSGILNGIDTAAWDPMNDAYLNPLGIDTAEWDPMNDAYLKPLGATWSATDLKGKAKAKQMLQQARFQNHPKSAPDDFQITELGLQQRPDVPIVELGLQQRPDVPIVAFIGRLAPQKGVDLIEQIFPWLMDKDQTG
ncbi:hypothetical protein T484DRAFT_1769858, partial [Baffinella frigidus]